MIGTSTSNPNEGVIAGFNGLLAHSIDNFLTVREDSNWKHNIVDGHHRNSITIATSDSSTILTSTDLFKTYQTFNAKHYVTNANRLFLFSPFIADDSTAFVKASDYDSLTKQLTNFVPYSTNTGTTWSKLSNVPNLLKDESNSGFKYFFRHKRDFRIVVSKYKLPSIETYVFHTTDGGVTWVDETPRSVLQQFDDLNAPGNIVFTSDSSGIITGRNKSTDKDSAGFSFLITRDNGATWKRHFVKDDPEISKYYTNYYENALNVYGINDSLFVANFSIVTGDVTYYSTDYGSTWNRLFFKKNEFCLYNSINFFSVDFAQMARYCLQVMIILLPIGNSTKQPL